MPARALVRGLLLVLAGAAGGGAVPAKAHHGPREVIEQINRDIAAKGASGKLLVKRADEWRVLGQAEKAVDDYRSALELEPQSTPALYGLARVLLELDRAEESLRAAQRGADAVQNEAAAAPFFAFQARSFESLERPEEALRAWESANRVETPEAGWLLEHATLTGTLQGPRAKCEYLEKAKKRNPSVALRRAWLGALIEAGDFTEAAPYIEAGLERSRYDHAWLLLRAELRLRRGEHELARNDVEDAVRELQSRLQGRANPALEEQLSRAAELLKRMPRVNGPTESSPQARP